MPRKGRKLYVKLPKEGVPRCDPQDVVGVIKCVYGLVDAPHVWWISFSKTLRDLGMKQRDLDRCCSVGLMINSYKV